MSGVTNVTITSKNNSIRVDGHPITSNGIYNIQVADTGVREGRYLGLSEVYICSDGRIADIVAGDPDLLVSDIIFSSSSGGLRGDVIRKGSEISLDVNLSQQVLLKTPNVPVKNPKNLVLTKEGIVSSVDDAPDLKIVSDGQTIDVSQIANQISLDIKPKNPEVAGDYDWPVGTLNKFGMFSAIKNVPITSSSLNIDSDARTIELLDQNVATQEYLFPVLSLNKKGVVTSIREGGAVTSIQITSNTLNVSPKNPIVSSGSFNIDLMPQSGVTEGKEYLYATVIANKNGIITGISENTPVTSFTATSSSGTLKVSVPNTTNNVVLDVNMPTIMKEGVYGVGSYTVNSSGCINSFVSQPIGVSSDGTIGVTNTGINQFSLALPAINGGGSIVPGGTATYDNRGRITGSQPPAHPPLRYLGSGYGSFSSHGSSVTVYFSPAVSVQRLLLLCFGWQNGSDTSHYPQTASPTTSSVVIHSNYTDNFTWAAYELP